MEYVIMALFIAAIIGAILVMIKLSNKKLAEVESRLTDEQIARLYAAEVTMVEGKKACWRQEAMIAEVKDKGSKYGLYILFCNRVNNNNFLNKLENADVTIKKSEFEAKGLSVGSFVNLEINAEKSKAVIL